MPEHSKSINNEIAPAIDMAGKILAAHCQRAVHFHSNGIKIISQLFAPALEALTVGKAGKVLYGYLIVNLYLKGACFLELAKSLGSLYYRYWALIAYRVYFYVCHFVIPP